MYTPETLRSNAEGIKPRKNKQGCEYVSFDDLNAVLDDDVIRHAYREMSSHMYMEKGKPSWPWVIWREYLAGEFKFWVGE